MTPLGRGILDRANCVAHAPFAGEDYRANTRGVDFLLEANEWVAAEIAAQYCNLDHLPEDQKDKRREELAGRADSLFEKAVAGYVQGRIPVIAKLIFVADAVFHGYGDKKGMQAAAALALGSVEECPRKDAEHADKQIAVQIAEAEVWPNLLTEAEAAKVREGVRKPDDQMHVFQMLLREAVKKRSGADQEDGDLADEEIAETETKAAVPAAKPKSADDDDERPRNLLQAGSLLDAHTSLFDEFNAIVLPILEDLNHEPLSSQHHQALYGAVTIMDHLRRELNDLARQCIEAHKRGCVS